MLRCCVVLHNDSFWPCSTGAQAAFRHTAAASLQQLHGPVDKWSGAIWLGSSSRHSHNCNQQRPTRRGATPGSNWTAALLPSSSQAPQPSVQPVHRLLPALHYKTFMPGCPAAIRHLLHRHSPAALASGSALQLVPGSIPLLDCSCQLQLPAITHCCGSQDTRKKRQVEE